MRKLFLLFTFFAVGSITAQGNGDIVQFDFIRTTPGEQYNQILNQKWKELAQKRADEGTITGWDTWWRANATPESECAGEKPPRHYLVRGTPASTCILNDDEEQGCPIPDRRAR